MRSLNASVVQKVSRYAAGVLLFTCAAVPFHAFLTVWAGSIFGHYTLWRLWPELLLLPLVGWTGYLLYRDKKLRQRICKSRLTWLLAAYVALHLALALWALCAHRVTATALAEGLILNLRLPVFFFVAQVLASKTDRLHTQWRRFVLIPAAIVVVFGLLQTFVLPPNFLQHFGYGPHTIAPYETVDQKADFVRTQSTLRGANPLGAYLVIVAAALVVGWLSRTRWIKRVSWVSLAATLVVLGYTYSRSAYLGVAVAIAALGWWVLRIRFLKRLVVIGFFLIFAALLGLASSLQHNDKFQNTFFHTDEHSVSAHSSNKARSTALQSGLKDLVHQPLGDGPGTAGPASAHNDHPARLAENYYLQIGQEVGWVGLGLFVAINLLIARQLARRKAEPLPRMLLASLLGITVINLVSHAWADDTLAILWWSLAGVALATPRAA